MSAGKPHEMLICYDPYVGTLGDYSSSEIFAMVSDAGFEGINVHISEPFFAEYVSGEIDVVGELAEKYSLYIPSLYFGHAIITDPDLVGQTRDHFAFCLEVAARFDVGIIGMWPNLPDGLFLEDALETLAGNLESMAEALGEREVKLTLEFERGCPLDNYLMAISFVEQCDPRVAIACDTYHLNNHAADPYRAVMAMKQKLQEVHLSGSDRLEPNSEGDTFDYRTFVDALREIGYAGPLTAQYHLKDPASLRRVSTFMRTLLA